MLINIGSYKKDNDDLRIHEVDNMKIEKVGVYFNQKIKFWSWASSIP